MTPAPGAARLAALLRRQARACAELGSPLYAGLMGLAAEDLLAGGPVALALAGHEEDPSDSVPALRLFGGVHRLVLARRAPRLALHYPSAGGTAGPAAEVWPAFREVVAGHVGELRAGLGQAPQTNEAGRAAALLGGLLHVAAQAPLPVRLVEIGASAGLNLRADAFCLRFPGGGWGDPASPVVLDGAWAGALPPLSAPLRVVEREGSDPAPVDPASTAGRLLLTSYVWPDQVERLERLRGALEVARRVPAALVRAGAAEAVAGLRLRTGRTTVLWHSVMWQYLPPAEQEAVLTRLDELGAAAGEDARLAHLSLEPRDGTFEVVLRTWPGGGAARVLGSAPPHGLPVTWGS